MHTTNMLKSFYRPLLKRLRRTVLQQNYHIVQPGVVSPARIVPDHIVRPPYADTGEPPDSPGEPEIKTDRQIEGVRTACKLARSILDKAGKQLRVGMTTDEIDEIVHSETISCNAYPSPLNYRGFPKSVCTSVNNVMCHGIPDDRALEDGDMINIDVSVFYRGYHGDTSETYGVGKVDKRGQRLMEVGRECLHAGISVCRPGARFCDIGMAISEYAVATYVSVVPQIIGHGIGTFFHGPPDIYHVAYQTPQTTQRMKTGMTFTIEPIVCEGSPSYTVHSDKWSLLAKDDSRSVQYEHTVLITSSGVDILSKYYTDYGEI